MKTYLDKTILALLVITGSFACETDEPIDWTQEQYYSPSTDNITSDSLVLELADSAFANRLESIEDIAERLMLEPMVVQPFAFQMLTAEVDENEEVLRYLPGLYSGDLIDSDSIKRWAYQTGRYVFRFQESPIHRFVSINEKINTRTNTDSFGQTVRVAERSSARFYVNDEDIVDEVTGLKRDRLTFTEGISTENLNKLYPDLPLPLGTFSILNYRYNTEVDDIIDDGVVNEKRVRVLLVVYNQ